ncbi:MAG: hypothetical protein E7174_05270 [Firmicutes bacterium]|nr:hypothetical protein [Bacillota bacterium]
MKIWQIILLVLACSFAGFLLFAKKAVNTYEDTIDDAKNSANQRTAELIISTVQLAYSTAYLNNKGYPTLEQVKTEFNSEIHANWNSDYVIESNSFNCTVEVINNYLKVTCLELETTNEMILSN